MQPWLTNVSIELWIYVVLPFSIFWKGLAADLKKLCSEWSECLRSAGVVLDVCDAFRKAGKPLQKMLI